MRLAREARSEDIHDATPRATVEAGKVVEDRRRTKDAFFHSRDQIRDDKGFPLHETDGGVGGTEDEVERQLESADAGAKGESVECGTKSHAIHVFFRVDVRRVDVFTLLAFDFGCAGSVVSAFPR